MHTFLQEPTGSVREGVFCYLIIIVECCMQMWNCKSTTLIASVELPMLAATFAVKLQMCQQHMWLAGWICVNCKKGKLQKY